MVDRLGILVHTNRHPEYVRQLAQAAAGLQKEVHVHFSGEGRQLAGHPALAGLGDIARVTVANEDESAGADRRCRDPRGFFRTCDRCVVF